MKKHHRNIGTPISLLLIAAVMIGGTLVFLTAPGQKISDDPLQLQQELQENAEFLAEQEAQGEQTPQDAPASQETIVPTPPTISDDSAGSEMPKESTVQFTAIGDSVMLGAAPALKEMFPDSVISAAESRQVWETETITAELEAKGELMDTVVIALGANGSFSKKQGQALLDSFGQDCTLYWVAPYGKNLYWKDSTLEILKELEAENENLTVLNWPEEAEQHSDWFYDDGMHLNSAGQSGYAQFLMEQVSS